MKQNYQLPKGYLSFSQITLWEFAKESYRKQYYPEKKPAFVSSVYMRFGNEVTEAMEKGENWVSFIPRLSEFEHRFDCTIGGVRLKGSIDQFDYKNRYFDEQKTTMTKWSKNKINNHFQLDLYSLVIDEIHGEVDNNCGLLWVETQKNNSDTPEGLSNSEPAISLTGKFELIPRIITKQDRIEAKERIIKVAKEISEDWKAMKHLYY